MKEPSEIRLFIVDDDIVYLKSLEIEFKQFYDFQINTFPTGELCIENLSLNPDVIILDYYLNGIVEDAMDGIETLIQIKLQHPTTPVIMLSAQDKIDVAVNCMHHKAYDYVVKSETSFLRLQKAIQSIFEFQRLEKVVSWYKSKA